MIRPAPPSLRLPRTEGSFRRSIAGSAALHVALIAVLIWAMRPAALMPPATPGPPGPLGGGGGAQRVTFLTFAPPAPPAPRPAVAAPVTLPVIREIPVELPRPVPIPERVVADVLVAPPGQAGGTGAGPGSGSGTGPGRGVGPGTGGTGGDIFPPQARYSILPPLPKPATVRGKSFQVRFWVNAAGRVTRVQVSPEIPDGAYRKKFLALMYEYTFEPARKLDGTPVGGETIITVTL